MPKPSKSVAMARATTTARRLRQVMGWIPRSEHAVRTKVQRHEDSFNPFALSLSKGRSFFAVRSRTVLRHAQHKRVLVLLSAFVSSCEPISSTSGPSLFAPIWDAPTYGPDSHS